MKAEANRKSQRYHVEALEVSASVKLCYTVDKELEHT